MPAERSFLGRWGGFLSVTAALALCFSTSSLPTPLYPLYQAAWSLAPSAISYVFAAYMVAVLVALLCLGRLSDTVGRFPVIAASLLSLMTGLALSAFAWGVTPLIVARAIIGFGNGLLTTAAAMALIESHPRHDRRVAGIAASIPISVGFGFGPVAGGALAQIGVAPLSLPYLFVFLLAMACLAMAWRHRAALQGPLGIRARLSVRPQMALPSRRTRAPFMLASAGAFSNFTVGCLFASLVPSLMQKLLPWQGPLVVGMVFLPMALACVGVQLLHRNVAPFRGLMYGMLSLVGSVASLCLGLLVHNVAALVASVIFTGMGQGYTFMSSVVIAGANVDEHRRAANMSTYFFAAYIGATVPVIAVGLLADRIGLQPAVFVFSAVVACVLVLLALRCLKYARAAR